MIFFFWAASLFYLTVLYPGLPFYVLFLDIYRRLRRVDSSHCEFSPSAWPAISFIIPVFNESAVIERKLVNTLELQYPGKLEIIVVDDGSTDSTIGIVNRLAMSDSRVICISNQRLGKAHALRTGMIAANGDLTVTGDADTFLNKIALVEATKSLAKYSDAGCVSGVITSARGSAGLFHRLGEHIRVMESEVWTASHPSGVFACFRRELVDDLTESSSTDVDIGLRVIKKGFKIRVIDSIKCEHQSPKTLSRDFLSFVVRPFVGRLDALRKNSSLIFGRGQNPSTRFIVLKYLVLFMFEPLAFFAFSFTSLFLLHSVLSEAAIEWWTFVLIFVGLIAADFLSKNLVSKALGRRMVFYLLEIFGLVRYAFKGPYTKWRMSRRG